MPASQWRPQDAKTQFSRVVDAALRGEPQHIARRGRQVVAVLSEQAFESLRQDARAAAPGFVAHLLAMRKDDQPVERIPVALRDVDFP